MTIIGRFWVTAEGHGGQVGVRYSDHYQEQGIFQRLMERLRTIAGGASGFAPVVTGALRC